MYFVGGGATLLWGFALWWLFPENPQHANGFSDEERKLLLERVRANNAGVENKTFKLYQAREALTDWQMWGIMLLSIASCTGSGVVTTFASIVFNGMGFTGFQSLLLNLPTGAMAILCILGSGYLGAHLRNSRLHVILCHVCPSS